MKKQPHDKAGRINRFDLILYFTILIVFGVLEFIAPPCALQPVVSLLIAIPLLAIFLAKKLVTKYAVFRSMILIGAFTLVNVSMMNLHITTGWVDSKSPWPEIDRLLDEQFVGSALIAKDGKIYLNKSYSYADRNRFIPNTHTTKFLIGSMTKQFTAMGILMLRDQGKLELEGPICQYLPECPQAWGPVKIFHLLTHTSGIADPTQIIDPQVPEGTPFIDRYALKIRGALKFFHYIQQPATVSKVIEENKDIPLEFLPGEKFKYSNSGYVLLGYIIENVSGKPYGDFIEEEIFNPLKMNNSGYGNQAPNLATSYINSTFKSYYIDISRAHGAGGLYSTVDDLYQWDQALYGEQLVKQGTLDEIFTPRVTIQGDQDMSYAYGWMVGEGNGRPVIMHGGSIGGYNSVLIRYPKDKISIILLSNDQRANFGIIIDEIIKKLGLK
jgi:CubicO group peptidase (beta-lactamase class C family)